ncbi:MAG TPA: hypothetical protein VFV78_11670 [Vicinamibacterales bacterium]|nr:hypothetical protein [Vicinamibacterales bacterium]
MRVMTTTVTMVAIALAGALATAQQAIRTVPVGTQIDLMLATELTSRTARPNDRFEADAIVDVKRGGQVVIPAGAVAYGFVGSVRATTPQNHQGQLTPSFDELRIGDQVVKLRASVVALFNPKRRPDSTRLGAPVDLADPGAMAPFPGVVISPGGSLNSMIAGDVLLPIGVVMRIRLDRALELK